ncbi:MAG TPA: zinc ribbon domain-containing protein [Gemmatimonadaceae bacterium]
MNRAPGTASFRAPSADLSSANMPTYEFACPHGHEFEKFYGKMSDAVAELPCPECGATAARQISGGAGLLFKGSGFYLTDYGKNAHRGEAKKRGDGSDAKSGDAKSGDAKSGEAKSGEATAGEAKSGDAKSGTSKAAESSSGSGGTKSDAAPAAAKPSAPKKPSE